MPPKLRTRLLPPYQALGPIRPEEFNARLYELAGSPGFGMGDYLLNEDVAWDLADHLQRQGWRIHLHGAGGTYAAEMVTDPDDGIGYSFVPQYGNTRAEALAKAMLDSLVRVRTGMAHAEVGNLAMCTVCGGTGYQRIADTQSDVLALLLKHGPLTAQQLAKLEPARTDTAYANALARLHRRKAVSRVRAPHSKAWVYRAIRGNA